jgi:Ca2+-binding RTX toxin-like protein
LATGSATDGFGNTDTLVSIEMVRGTNSADTLTGGNAASDNFEGYRGLGGDDTITGGSGYDEVRYDFDSTNGGANGVTVNLLTGTATDGFGDTDALSGIEGVRGTAQADTFIGDVNGNTFYGLAGDDTISGGDGFDFLRYDLDASNGGAGAVIVNLSSSSVTVGATTVAASSALDGFGNTDTLSDIQGFQGTTGADTFVGSDFIRFFGEAFSGLAGDDTLTGGLGYDEARYDNDASFGGAAGVVVDLAAGMATDGFGNSDTLIGIDNVRGTSQADSLTGNDQNNRFRGLGGNDTLTGGLGSDTADYSQDFDEGGTAAVTVNLALGTATDGFGNTDTLVDIDSARGTKLGDSFTGSDDDNSFMGFAGSDAITGGNGNDEVRYDTDWLMGGTFAVIVDLASGMTTDGFGDTDTLSSIEIVRGSKFGDTFTGSGADETFRGMAGNDTMDGGSGSDWVSYQFEIFGLELSQTLSAVTVNLGAGMATDGFGDADTLSNIENVAGGTLGDTLTGDASNNIFRGMAGNDTIDGGAGANTADYSRDKGYGDSVFLNGGNAVVVNLGTGTATDGFGNTDTLTNIQNIIGTAFGDTITGDGNGNALDGGDGNDSLSGSLGFDSITGGLGNDTIGGGDQGDLLSGGDGNDLINGGMGLDTIDGGIGNDTINSGVGNDSVTGGTGFDELHGFDGNDTLGGGDQGDLMFGELGDDVLNGGMGLDTIDGGAGNDTITGGLGGDSLTGGADADTFAFNTPITDGIDTITDFLSGTDTIQVSAAGYGGGLVANGAVTLVIADSLGSASSGAGGYFILDNSGAGLGTLYWDSNGGSGADAVAITVLTGISSLQTSDFHVV